MPQTDLKMDEIEFQEHTDATKHPKERIFDHLLRIEKHVESLRKETYALESMKNTLMVTLDSLKCSELLTNLDVKEVEDIMQDVDRVVNKCLTVDISVRTTRNREEEEALHKVNSLIDTAVVVFQADNISGKSICESYLSACILLEDVTPNEIFHQHWIKCSEDDQKIIADRINGLLNYMDEINKLKVTEMN